MRRCEEIRKNRAKTLSVLGRVKVSTLYYVAVHAEQIVPLGPEFDNGHIVDCPRLPHGFVSPMVLS